MHYITSECFQNKLKNITCQCVVHVESKEFDFVQVKTSIDENPEEYRYDKVSANCSELVCLRQNGLGVRTQCMLSFVSLKLRRG